jgi:hypothetical protein
MLRSLAALRSTHGRATRSAWFDQPCRTHCLDRLPSRLMTDQCTPRLDCLLRPACGPYCSSFEQMKVVHVLAPPRLSLDRKRHAASPLYRAGATCHDRLPRQDDSTVCHSVAQMERLGDPPRRHSERSIQGERRRLSKAEVLRCSGGLGQAAVLLDRHMLHR